MQRQLFIVACCLIAVAPAQADELVPFPAQPLGVAFPTENWPEFDAANGTRRQVEHAMSPAFEGQRPAALERSRALLVVWQGKIVGERYSQDVTQNTRLQSWSMAKSFLHAALGIAIGDHLLSPQQPVGAPEWRSDVDPRRTITIRQMAQMTDGLDFREQYTDATASALQMLFGEGRGDVGAFAARSDRAYAPGTHWSYSSGSANILSRMLKDHLGGRDAYLRLLRERLFQPLGIRSAVPEFDASGTWIGSSYIHATARDFARFGLLYLRGGMWDGQQIVPRDWVNIGRVPTMASRGAYGALFWLNAADPETGKSAISPKLPADMFMARGFGGQFIAIIPSRDAVIVMLNAAYAEDTKPIIDVVANILDALPR